MPRSVDWMNKAYRQEITKKVGDRAGDRSGNRK
jgi:hypothetical protein